MSSEKSPSVLFLTTQDPSEIKAEWPYYQNWTLPKAIEEHGATVSIRCWKDESLDASAIAKFNIVTFLWCNNYHNHAETFPLFLRNVLEPAQKLSPRLRILNDTSVILWNVDKHVYLPQLTEDGLLTPDTTFVKQIKRADGDTSDLEKHVSSFATDGGAVVLKPSISGSSKQTHLIRNPLQLTPENKTYLQSIVQSGVDGSLMIQRYESGIERGEYSMVFIGGKHTHTMLKTPRRGEFRCQHEFGAGCDEIAREDVPSQALETADKIVRNLERKFEKPVLSYRPKPEQAEGLLAWISGSIAQASQYLRKLVARLFGSEMLPNESSGAPPAAKENGLAYVRVDGVIRDNGDFVLMEVEAIEPHLWLETAVTPGIREQLYKTMLGF